MSSRLPGQLAQQAKRPGGRRRTDILAAKLLFLKTEEIKKSMCMRKNTRLEGRSETAAKGLAWVLNSYTAGLGHSHTRRAEQRQMESVASFALGTERTG